MSTQFGTDSANDDGYWRALLEQGEVVSNPTPPDEWASPCQGGPGSQFSLGQSSRCGQFDLAQVADEFEAESPRSNPTQPEWNALEKALRSGELFSARVIGCNRGGLLVRVGEIVGFVPASQLTSLPRQLRSEELRDQLERMIGRELQLKLIELDSERNRVILSERAVSWPDRDLDSWFRSLTPGQILNGYVRSLCEFGAFIDLGGIDGLVHISEISWQRVNRASDVLTIGQPVKVIVLNVDAAQRRIGLSIKRIYPDPWSLVDKRYTVGQNVEVTITNVVDFGAFARLEEGVEGLVHVSELAEGNFLHPRNVITEGEVVTARILNIDSVNRRIGLSLRQAFSAWNGASELPDVR